MLSYLVGLVCFKVFTNWLNDTLTAVSLPPAPTSKLKFSKLKFFVVELVSFGRFFSNLEATKSQKGLIRTVWRSAKQYNTLLSKKLVQKIRWVRWRIILAVKPTFLDQKCGRVFLPHYTIVPSFSVHIHGAKHLHNKKNSRHWLDIAWTLTHFFACASDFDWCCHRRTPRTGITINKYAATFETIIPPFNSGFDYKLIPKGRFIWIVSELVFLSLKQNLIQTR